MFNNKQVMIFENNIHWYMHEIVEMKDYKCIFPSTANLKCTFSDWQMYPRCGTSRLAPGFLNWGAWKVRKGGASMAATCCWKLFNALFYPFVNLLWFHGKRHNQNKWDKTKSRNKLECAADFRCAVFNNAWIKQLVPEKQLRPSHWAG